MIQTKSHCKKTEGHHLCLGTPDLHRLWALLLCHGMMVSHAKISHQNSPRRVDRKCISDSNRRAQDLPKRLTLAIVFPSSKEEWLHSGLPDLLPSILMVSFISLLNACSIGIDDLKYPKAGFLTIQNCPAGSQRSAQAGWPT